MSLVVDATTAAVPKLGSWASDNIAQDHERNLITDMALADKNMPIHLAGEK
jgi:hypothetical protein